MDYNGREVPFRLFPSGQSIEVSAPTRDAVYFIAPGKLYSLLESKIKRKVVIGCKITYIHTFYLNIVSL